jgi:hypothetical protein
MKKTIVAILVACTAVAVPTLVGAAPRTPGGCVVSGTAWASQKNMVVIRDCTLNYLGPQFRIAAHADAYDLQSVLSCARFFGCGVYETFGYVHAELAVTMYWGLKGTTPTNILLRCQAAGAGPLTCSKAAQVLFRDAPALSCHVTAATPKALILNVVGLCTSLPLTRA